jgi:hypothetical protein
LWVGDVMSCRDGRSSGGCGPGQERCVSVIGNLVRVFVGLWGSSWWVWALAWRGWISLCWDTGWGTPPEVDPCLRLRQPNDCSPLPRPFRPGHPGPAGQGVPSVGFCSPLASGRLPRHLGAFQSRRCADLRLGWDFPVPALRLPAFPPDGPFGRSWFLGYQGFSAPALPPSAWPHGP